MSLTRLGKPGKKHSEETRKLIGDLQRGEKHKNYGKHLPETTKTKIKVAQCTPVVAYTDEHGVYMYYISYQAAQRVHGYYATHISKCILGKAKTHGKTLDGYPLKWRCATDEESLVIKGACVALSKEYMSQNDYKSYGGYNSGDWHKDL